MLLALLRIDWQNPISAALVAASTLTASLTDVEKQSASLSAQSTLTANIAENVRLSSSLAASSIINSSLLINHPLSSNLANLSSVSAILIDQDTLFSILSAQPTLSPSLQLQKILSSAPVATALTIGRLGTSISAGLSSQSSISGIIVQTTELNSILTNQIILNANLSYVWDREFYSQHWMGRPGANKATPPYGLLALSWFSPPQIWDRKSVDAEPWIDKTPVDDSWNKKTKSSDPWVRKHG